MDTPSRELSLTLDSVARAIAEWTVTRHEELDPTLSARYGKDWRRSWVADTEMRIRHLAQAIAVRRPRLMVEATAWSRLAHMARGLDAGDIDTNVRSLHDVLGTAVPEHLRAVALAYTAQAIEEAPRTETPNGEPVDLERPHGELALRYLEAMLSGRRRDAESIILDAVDGGVTVGDIYKHVLTPTQAEMGRMWHRGEITIADEHAATLAAETIMSMLRLRFRNVSEHERRVLSTSVGGDLHSMGVRMVTDYFEMDGWRAVCLGANMPPQDILQALVDYEVDLLALSASSTLNLRTVGELIDDVHADPALSDVKILVGGRPFILVPDLWTELGADGFAETADEAVALGNRLVTDHRVPSA